MTRYSIQLPVAGIIAFEIEAENEEDAIKKAILSDEINTKNLIEWDAYEKLVEGNCVHAPLWEAEVEEIDE